MYCKNCGKEIADNSKFCKYCGENIERLTNTTNKTITKYNLILIDCGDNKVGVIKVIRDITGLGLVEAKNIVDNTPKCVLPNLSYEKYLEYEKKLIGAGADVKFKKFEQNIPTNSNEKNTTLKNCPICGNMISKVAQNCPHCGHPFKQQSSDKGKGFGGVVLAIIVAFFIMAFL